MTVGILYDERFLLHDPGPWHPECPARLTAVWNILKKQPWFNELVILPTRPADLAWIAEVHSQEYIERVRSACLSGESFLDCPDVGINKHSFDVAVLAVGGVLALADALMTGQIHCGMGLVRPPGHHARPDEAMGFCLFNNIAILARYLQKRYALHKICIIDWDVHHGNGTQEVFYQDPTVCYISLHQYPFYPGSGGEDERGEGHAIGKTLNCPMTAFAGDDEYKQVFEKIILPEVEKFNPDAILVSAGFDAHKDDPLAQIQLSTPMFGWMTEKLLLMSQKMCEGRFLSILEGGYSLDRLGECVVEHVGTLVKMKKDRTNE